MTEIFRYTEAPEIIEKCGDLIYYNGRKDMAVMNKKEKTDYPDISPAILAKIRDGRFMDDEFLTACFKDRPDCMELILRIILDRPDLAVDRVWVQHYIKNIHGRSLQLDLHSKTTGEEFNIEVQRESRGAKPRRARYHGSVLDSDTLDPGDDFEKLPETYVIFITEKDIYGNGRPVYHVERFVMDDAGGQTFDDGLHILYVNGAYRGDDDLGKLMHDFRSKNPDDMNYTQLSERARYFKETEEGVRRMSDWMKSYVDEEKLKIAVKMLETGKLSYDEISKILDLPLEEVEELAGNKSA